MANVISVVVDERGVIESLDEVANFEVKVGNNARIVIATLSELTNVRDSVLQTGAEAFITSRSAWFVLDKSTSTAVVDGLIVATRSGSGRWVRRDSTTSKAASQTTWYIDSSLGSDDNDGSTANAALKTWAELERRWSTSRLTGHYYIFIPNGLPLTDPIYMTRTQPGVGFEVHFFGGRTQVATGTISAVTTFNRTTGQHTEITISGFDWSTHVGRMIRVTSGVREGVTAWVDADLGSGVARISAPNQTTYGTIGTTSFSTLTQTNVQVGDSIEIVTLAEIAQTPNIDFGQGTTSSGRITFEDFYFSQTTFVVGTGLKTGSIRIIRCDVRYQENTGANAWTIYHNSKVGTVPFGIGRVDVRGGLVTGTVDLAAPGGISLVGLDCLFSATARLSATAGMGAGMIQIANVGIAGCTGVWCVVNIKRSVQLTGIIYGTTVNQNAFQVRSGGAIISSAGTTPTLSTGSAANIDMRNSITKAWADLATVYTNPATGSQILFDS